MLWKSFVKDNRNAVSLCLILIWLLAVWHFKTLNSFVYPVICVFSMSLFDLFITWLRTKKLYWPYSSWVSGLLIGLIIAPSEHLYVLLLACFFASVSKHFVGSGTRRHIFNPAAFGIMAVYLTFATPVAWWAVAWSKWPVLILIVFMARILFKLKRLFLPLGFLVVYGLFLAIITRSAPTVLSLADGTVMLFALVMVPEIITSPASGYFKYLFGALVAAVVILLSIWGRLFEVYLPGLLVADLATFLLIKRQKSKFTVG